MNEIEYRPIEGYNESYEVSAHGTVRSKDRVIILPNGEKRQIKGRVLIPKKNKDGYLFVTLSKNGKAQTMYLHRAAATAFKDNHENLPEVNHLDGNKLNNNIDNLAWVTHQQNVQHCYDIDLCGNKGDNHTFAVGVIDNTLGKEFGTIKDWCAARGINYSTGRNLLSGHNVSKKIDLTEVFKKQQRKINGEN